MRGWFGGQGTRRGRQGRGRRDDGLEGVDGKSVEEFMGENEWGFGGICRERIRLVKTIGKGELLERFTVRYKTYVFTPRYRKS